jgi:hypothetical protein
MTTTEVEQRLLERYGLRAGPAMRQYVIDRMNDADRVGFPIMAGDARTGMPVRQVIAPAEFVAAGIVR